MALAHSCAPWAATASASSIQACFRSSSSTPMPTTVRMMPWQVRMDWDFSHSTASLSHCSRLISTPFARSEVMALSMIFSTMWALLLASSSLAAVIQICRSVGIFSRALFSTLRALS
uniref:Uncharacterized protein n=1 Tax=Ixodes ricinus TaxID=34613 RepID=A0A6B0ULS9_IXORI